MSFTGFSLHSLVAALRDDVAFVELIVALELLQLGENILEIVKIQICVKEEKGQLNQKGLRQGENYCSTRKFQAP